MRNRKILFILLLLILVRVDCTSIGKQISNTNTNEDYISVINYSPSLPVEPVIKSYVPHAPIEILSNDYFLNYSFTVSGTELEPYLIENYNITTSNDTGVLIQNTTKHFVIKNCLIKAYKQGITIDSVAAGTAYIENNECAHHVFNGINIIESLSSTVVNNTAHHNHHMGISVGESGSSLISENRCYQNSWGGIIYDEGHHSEITNNEITNNNYYGGLTIYYSFNIIVRNNTFSNNGGSDINCRKSDGVEIESNYFPSHSLGGGISISDCTEVTVLNNTVNVFGNGISVYRSIFVTLRYNYLYNSGFYLHQSNITDYFYLDIQDNYVNNQKLGFFYGKDQIKIKESQYGQLIFIDCSNVKVENQGQDRGFIGITVNSCDSVVIRNSRTLNLEQEYKNWGLVVLDSEAVEVINCIFNYGRGIYLENTMNSIIKSNLCSNNSFGIYFDNSDYCDLTNNTCSNNRIAGMNLYRSDYCVITYNRIFENGFTDWKDFGLELSGNFNILHHNAFYKNNFNGTINVIDYGDNNTWFDEKTLKGNYYDDWSGIGTYQIPGPANATDPYPLSEIPVYTEANYFSYYFSVILIFPIITFTLYKLISKRKS